MKKAVNTSDRTMAKMTKIDFGRGIKKALHAFMHRLVDTSYYFCYAMLTTANNTIVAATIIIRIMKSDVPVFEINCFVLIVDI